MRPVTYKLRGSEAARRKGNRGVRILVPTVDYPPIEGGISTVATQVARELASLGHEVTVLAPYFPGMESFDAGEPVRVVRFRGYGLGWGRLVPFMMRAWPLMRPHPGPPQPNESALPHPNPPRLRGGDVDHLGPASPRGGDVDHLGPSSARGGKGPLGRCDLVLAINVAYGGLLARLAQARCGVPYIAFAYAYEFLKFRSVPLASGVLRGVYEHACATIAISRFTAGNLARLGVPEDRVHVILPGAPPARDVPDSTFTDVKSKYGLGEGPVILSVGRLIERKGQECLIRAFRGVMEAFPGARLVFAGRGPMLERCKALAHELGVATSVVFAGYVDEMALAALYRLCDVFALPAGDAGRGQVEGFGLVFAEAGAYSKPVVGGRSGGVEDAIIDGETGLLVEPGDVDALADMLLRLLRDPAYARRLGEAGRQRVETELNWRAFTQRMLDVAGFGA